MDPLKDIAASALVVLIVALPGLPGELIYRSVAGVSWREKELQGSLRLLWFSVLGLASYTLIAAKMGLAVPDYLIPSTFSEKNFQAAVLPNLAGAYLGQVAAATAVGGLVAAIVVVLRMLTSRYGHRDAWDEFIHCVVPKRWVIVHLRTGESYAGFICHADVAAERDDRDLILAEPYLWDENERDYRPTYNQWLFLHGNDVCSLSIVHDPSVDRRIAPVEDGPFLRSCDGGPKETDNKSKQGRQQAGTADAAAGRPSADAPAWSEAG